MGAHPAIHDNLCHGREPCLRLKVVITVMERAAGRNITAKGDEWPSLVFKQSFDLHKIQT